MGLGVSELLLIFLIVLVLFGTQRLRNIGSDLGSAIKSFRNAMNESDSGKVEPTVHKDTTEDDDSKPK